MKVTQQIVKLLYKSILRREPESLNVIENHCNHHECISSLLDSLLTSQEFLSIVASKDRSLNGDEKRMCIDYEIDIEDYFYKIKNQWLALGKSRPFWSVLTQVNYLKPTKDNITNFYIEGEEEINFLINVLKRLDIDLNDYNSCLEYGCGLGRSTLALSKVFRKVYGFDISYEHLSIAERECKTRNISSISFNLIKDFTDIDSLPSVDFFYTQFVLQHNPPPLILHILDRLFKSLNVNGIGFFQVPTYLSNYEFTKKSFLNNDEQMELHAVEQEKVFQLLHKNSMSLVDIYEDNAIGLGKGNRSNTMIVRKK